MANDINSRREIKDDANLHESFGMPVPRITGTKGEINNFGELAGSTSSGRSVLPKRNICFEDSVSENQSNQPKSH